MHRRQRARLDDLSGSEVLGLDLLAEREGTPGRRLREEHRIAAGQHRLPGRVGRPESSVTARAALISAVEGSGVNGQLGSRPAMRGARNIRGSTCRPPGSSGTAYCTPWTSPCHQSRPLSPVPSRTRRAFPQGHPGRRSGGRSREVPKAPRASRRRSDDPGGSAARRKPAAAQLVGRERLKRHRRAAELPLREPERGWLRPQRDNRVRRRRCGDGLRRQEAVADDHAGAVLRGVDLA